MIIFMIFTQKSVFRVEIENFEISRNPAYVCHIPINGIIWKKYGTIVKIIFSHAERFESCTTTTRNEYLKSIFCLYSTHSIYPEIKFQIQIVSLFVRIWLTHSFGITVLYTNRTHSIVTRVSSWRPIYSFVDVDSFRTKINLIKM